MPRVNRRKLQSLINRTVKHGAAYHRAQAALNDYCNEVYGKEPGDVDCDQVIDAVLGGGGTPTGLTATEFDDAMREAMARS